MGWYPWATICEDGSCCDPAITSSKQIEVTLPAADDDQCDAGICASLAGQTFVLDNDVATYGTLCFWYYQFDPVLVCKIDSGFTYSYTYLYAQYSGNASRTWLVYLVGEGGGFFHRADWDDYGAPTYQSSGCATGKTYNIPYQGSSGFSCWDPLWPYTTGDAVVEML